MQTDVNSSISKRVFLVGCPRSGTTLLQSMLMGHPRVASYPETHFFARGFGGRRRWLVHRTLRGWYLWYLLAHWLVVHQNVPLAALRNVPVSWSKARMVETFRQILDQRTIGSNKDIWIEKTPRHLHRIDVIEDYIPSPVFIHIVRDGRAVVASLHQLAKSSSKTWGAYRSVDAAVRRWNQSVQDTLQHALEDTHLTVGYDHLVEAPEKTLRRVATFLDVAYDSTMVERFQDEAQRVVKEHESWKARATSSKLQNRGLEKFRRTFSADERTSIKSKLDWSSYQDLGYEPL